MYLIVHDIFNIKENNYVVFPNGNYLTNKVYYNNSAEKYKLLNNTKEVSEEYIEEYAKKAELELSVANAIIMYDLRDDKSNKGE